jgi:hypothetical protein
VPEPSDLLKAWQEAIRDLGGTAASLASGPAGPLLRPLQRQADLLERILERQLEFERELVGRVTAPAQTALELVEQATTAMRGQAAAFRAAATSFGQAADLLEQQADLIDLTRRTVADPLGAIRAAGSALPGRGGEPPDPGDPSP